MMRTPLASKAPPPLRLRATIKGAEQPGWRNKRSPPVSVKRTLGTARRAPNKIKRHK